MGGKTRNIAFFVARFTVQTELLYSHRDLTLGQKPLQYSLHFAKYFL